MDRTYASYLKIHELLALQQPCSKGPEHDEMLFIVAHQVYELWFKQILHELDHLQATLEGAGKDAELARPMGTLKRILTILKIQVAQVDVLETITPLEFRSFRGHLRTASGFQSCQFRELEFALGYKRQEALERFKEGSEERQRLELRHARPSLWRSFVALLARRGYAVPTAALDRDVTLQTDTNPEVQALLVEAYHRDPAVAQLCERLLDIDEGLQEWRYRHVKMVQRTIGSLPGTGGSAGVAYLQQTLFKPLFPDLWAIRGALHLQ